MATKVTVNLPDELVDELRRMAEERDLTMTQVLRQAIESERFLQDELSKGNKVLIENKKDKSIHQVIFK